MEGNNRFSKPVAFNNKKEIDQKILKHVKKKNFSGYVKKLILEDIKRKELTKNADSSSEDKLKIPAKEEVKPSISERLEQLKKAGNPASLSNKNID